MSAGDLQNIVIHEKRHAFSLVELSIVLVILGLLVGGVLSGQSLIHAAELRAISEEYKRYVTSTYIFRDKYFALPGDLTNATAFWGKDNTNCAGNSGTAAANGTCNGDGDGILDYGSPSGTAECFQFWKQLALAGLIEGKYTGISDAGSDHNAIIGTNVPASKLSSAGWSAEMFETTYHGDAYNYDRGTGSARPLINFFAFGTLSPGYETSSPALTAEDVWNIDTKMDDGKPGQGAMVVNGWTNCSTSANQNDFNGSYKFTVSGKNCGFNIDMK